MLKTLGTIIYFETKMTFREAYSWTTPLLFFTLVVCLFPLALEPDPILLNKIAAGVIWVAALLAILISIGNLFRQDQAYGHLDSMLLCSSSLTLIVFGKIFSHWVTHCLPLIVLTPLLSCLLGFTLEQACILTLSLLLGTPVLSLFGALGAALTIGIKQSSIMLPILIMPFYIPILIFGTTAADILRSDLSVTANLAFMTAILLVSLTVIPKLTSMALRIGVNQLCSIG